MYVLYVYLNGYCMYVSMRTESNLCEHVRAIVIGSSIVRIQSNGL